MEPILIKKSGKTQFVFHADFIEKIKGSKTIFIINVSDIESITYNMKFTFGDFITLLFFSKYGTTIGYGCNCFAIRSNVKPKLTTLNIKRSEYETLKNKFNKTITII